MDFTFDPHSPLPTYLQIQEQIKLALLLGQLRPGDTLPSIRDVEKQARVSRNIVRKAYLALQRSGILTLKHGKGVLVEKDLSYGERGSVMKQCETLSTEILGKAAKLGISSSAFARYLYQQARERERTAPFLIFVDVTEPIALERAAKISSFWHVNVAGHSIDQLVEMRNKELKGVRAVLTNYLRLDQVRKNVKEPHVDVIPVSLTFTQAMRDEFRRLPHNASVVLVLDDRDYPSLRLILESYKKILVDPSIRLTALPRSQVRDLERFVRSTKYHKVMFSNRIWEQVPEKLRKHPHVTRPQMDIDLASLESVRIRAGVVI
jgi:GntR family transcriptional regulator